MGPHANPAELTACRGRPAAAVGPSAWTHRGVVVGLTVPLPSWLWSGAQQLPEPCAHAYRRADAPRWTNRAVQKGPVRAGC